MSRAPNARCGTNIRLQYLAANQAWVFMHGDSIMSIRAERMARGGRRERTLFNSRQEAVDLARSKGLEVRSDGCVSPAGRAANPIVAAVQRHLGGSS